MSTGKKIFVVSGGTSGVGKAIATGLAKTGATVAIIGRNEQSGKETASQISLHTRNPNVGHFVADLSLQSSIAQLSGEIKNKFDHIDGLINAAGAIFFKKEMTIEGLDKSFAINYLSHFALTGLLLETLKKTGSARVLTVGGAPMYLKNPKIALDDIQLDKNYNGMTAISQAMFERVYFALELAHRLEGTGVTSNVFHPGLISSNLVKNAPWWLKLITSFLRPWEKKDCEIGVYLATNKEVENKNGLFFNSDKQIISLEKAFDAATGKKLWHITEELIKNIH